MAAVTRAEARRRRAADPTWQADLYEPHGPKTSKAAKGPKASKGSKGPQLSKVSKTPRMSKTKRLSKTRTSISKELQSYSLQKLLLTETISSKLETSYSSPAPPPRQATPSYTETISPWLDEFDRPDWSYFRATDWTAPSSVTGRRPSPQWSPKSLSPVFQPTLFGAPLLPLVNTEPANLKLGTVAYPPSYNKPTKIFKPKDNPRQSQSSSNHSSPQFKSIKKLNIKVVSPNIERPPCTSPSCPVHPVPHRQGTYLHGGASPKNHFTFAWSNPPPEVWDAHQKNRHDEATEEELELIANFRAYHDHRAVAGGITTSGICQNEPVKVRECSFSF